ncbi:MAG: hypothetical protein JRJ49_10210 [Deltaproteobacteria bacterium]|nr:hypothetical protein [Deltaproteobacteria bacterium]
MPLYNKAVYNATIKAIENVKNFNADWLSISDNSKQTINFPEAVKEIIGLYLRVSPEALKSLSDKQLNEVIKNANHHL